METTRDQSTDVDNSLRGKALSRTSDDFIPTTLTPYEWLEWYEKHGVSPSHQVQPENSEGRKRTWWRLFAGSKKSLF